MMLVNAVVYRNAIPLLCLKNETLELKVSVIMRVALWDMWTHLLVCLLYVFECVDLYKAEKLSVCLPVFIFSHHVDNLAAFASINTGLTQNESYFFWEHKVLFCKLT